MNGLKHSRLGESQRCNITRDFKSIGLLAIVSLLITFPIYLSNNIIFGHDIFQHLARSEQFYNALMEGVWYPRWLDTEFGYGNPSLLFYAPLSYYIISAIHVLIKSTILSMKIAISLSFFLSGISMYIFMNKFISHRAGLVSAVMYQILPYHLLDLGERGAVPELFSFIWLPLILLFTRKIFYTERLSSMVWLSFAYAALILTHLISSFLFTFVIVGYGLYLFLIERKRGFLRMLLAVCMGLSLSSVYLIPVVFERDFIHIEVAKKYYAYRDNFLLLDKEILKNRFRVMLNGIAAIDMAFFIVTFKLLRKKLLESRIAFFNIMIAVSIFMVTPFSLPIWKYIPGFSYLGLPWRWLEISGLSVAVISGELCQKFQDDVKKVVSFFFTLIFIVSLFILGEIRFVKDDLTRSLISNPYIFSFSEYRPIWLKDPLKELEKTEKVKIVLGTGSVEIIDWRSNYRILSVYGETPLHLKLSTFFYPGWEVFIDEKRCNIMTEQDTGAIVFEVPEGKHTIKLYFKDTQLRYSGKVISALTLAGLIVFLLYGRLRSPTLKKY